MARVHSGDISVGIESRSGPMVVYGHGGVSRHDRSTSGRTEPFMPNAILSPRFPHIQPKPQRGAVDRAGRACIAR